MKINYSIFGKFFYNSCLCWGIRFENNVNIYYREDGNDKNSRRQFVSGY